MAVNTRWMQPEQQVQTLSISQTQANAVPRRAREGVSCSSTCDQTPPEKEIWAKQCMCIRNDNRIVTEHFESMQVLVSSIDAMSHMQLTSSSTQLATFDIRGHHSTANKKGNYGGTTNSSTVSKSQSAVTVPSVYSNRSGSGPLQRCHCSMLHLQSFAPRPAVVGLPGSI